MNEQTVTIPLADWNTLQSRLNWLMDLEEAGVDNWQGYDEAIRIRRERLEKAGVKDEDDDGPVPGSDNPPQAVAVDSEAPKA